ncbi:type VI lipase adapter Tla3 domain-containing protein [Paraburkholderia tropica]|uniref:type VI lipase adapter Tla3 domain-containing protein n=1 Tax=Paraburkholderia tropica TaxID=92647 RepID=UPI001CC5C192|nr:DUF2875 family protein [Paraburkholderia tropica]
MTTSPLYSAPTSSPHLDTLSVVSIGLSLDVYRQGQVWTLLLQQDRREPNSLHVSSILPTDPEKYPVTTDTKNNAYDQRKLDALELALKDFREAWPIPTVTVVRGWNPKAPNLRMPPAETTETSLHNMVTNLRPAAGLHWHEINQLKNGVICNDTPESVVEMIFRTFEAAPDLPAILIYVVDGYNMAAMLSTTDQRIIGVGNGPRQPGELTDSIVALVVARPERVNWLRNFVKYTKAPPGRSIYPGFTGWEQQPRMAFHPSPFVPEPWTELGFKQWDAMKTLAILHRPVVVPLSESSKAGARLKNDALTSALSDGWTTAIENITPTPSRVFYDGGQTPVRPPLSDLIPALMAAGSPLDLLESNESYDLTQRLGDTGAASPFVAIALATMATYLNADTSMVVPLRRADQATLITLTSATPGRKPTTNPFGVNLLPQTASSETPSARIREQLIAEHQQTQPQVPYVPPRDPALMAREQRILDDFIRGGEGIDLSGEG